MLYHCSIGFPEVAVPSRPFRVGYTAHALRAARQDEIDADLLPKVVGPSARLIELETSSTGKPIKTVWRVPWDTHYDLVLVVALVDPFGFPARSVKTVWLNQAADDHPTLDIRRYTRP